MNLFKKIFILLLSFGFIFTISSCMNFVDNLDNVENVQIDEEGNITWDAVENASGYEIVIGDKIYKSETNSFSMEDRSETCEIVIYAINYAGDRSADASKSVKFLSEIDRAKLALLKTVEESFGFADVIDNLSPAIAIKIETVLSDAVNYAYSEEFNAESFAEFFETIKSSFESIKEAVSQMSTSDIDLNTIFTFVPVLMIAAEIPDEVVDSCAAIFSAALDVEINLLYDNVKGMLSVDQITKAEIDKLIGMVENLLIDDNYKFANTLFGMVKTAGNGAISILNPIFTLLFSELNGENLYTAIQSIVMAISENMIEKEDVEYLLGSVQNIINECGDTISLLLDFVPAESSDISAVIGMVKSVVDNFAVIDFEQFIDKAYAEFGKLLVAVSSITAEQLALLENEEGIISLDSLLTFVISMVDIQIDYTVTNNDVVNLFNMVFSLVSESLSIELTPEVILGVSTLELAQIVNEVTELLNELIGHFNSFMAQPESASLIAKLITGAISEAQLLCIEYSQTFDVVSDAEQIEYMLENYGYSIEDLDPELPIDFTFVNEVPNFGGTEVSRYVVSIHVEFVDEYTVQMDCLQVEVPQTDLSETVQELAAVARNTVEGLVSHAVAILKIMGGKQPIFMETALPDFSFVDVDEATDFIMDLYDFAAEVDWDIDLMAAYSEVGNTLAGLQQSLSEEELVTLFGIFDEYPTLITDTLKAVFGDFGEEFNYVDMAKSIFAMMLSGEFVLE